MNRLNDIIPTALLRTATAALALSVLVATVTATLLSPSGAEAAAIQRDRQALSPPACSAALEARASKAKAKETRRAKKAKAKRAKKVLQGTLNINNATADQLSLLPGVGPAKAERVVAYRNRHGKFRRVKDLRRVKGFGYKSLKKLDKWLTIKGKTTLILAKSE